MLAVMPFFSIFAQTFVHTKREWDVQQGRHSLGQVNRNTSGQDSGELSMTWDGRQTERKTNMLDFVFLLDCRQ